MHESKVKYNASGKARIGPSPTATQRDGIVDVGRESSV